jgi:hypothetical protein
MRAAVSPRVSCPSAASWFPVPCDCRVLYVVEARPQFLSGHRQFESFDHGRSFDDDDGTES